MTLAHSSISTFRRDYRDTIIAQQRERIERLEVEIRELRTVLCPDIHFPHEWKLTRRHSQVLGAVYVSKTEWTTAERIFSAVWGGFGSSVNMSIVQPTVSNLRQRLRAIGLDIIGRVGRGRFGYRLPDETRHAISKALEEMRGRG